MCVHIYIYIHTHMNIGGGALNRPIDLHRGLLLWRPAASTEDLEASSGGENR